ncbi:MAG: hypothetical protein C4530_17930 [Desulfobacteraceae bacterium]|nr:MAG: hypothetical protein C4530_17930 [Desulfobacteraceae bacterium]
MTEFAEIFVTLSTFGEYSEQPIELLKGSGFSYGLNDSGKRMTPEEVSSVCGHCSGLIAGVEKYDACTLSRLPELKCISRVGAGTDNIDRVYAREKGIAIMNTPDAPTAAVAELTLGMILSLLRRLPEVNDAMHVHRWQRFPGRLLSGKTVGIIGLGRIGRRVAELVATFGARVIGTDPDPDIGWMRRNDVKIVTLPDLLTQSDIVSLHAAGSKETPLRLGHSEFSVMKRGSWFINMARGDMVDDRALHAALLSGHIAGTGLDVYPGEPYSGPLCDHPGAILSPHQATLTMETRVAMETEAVQNLLEYLRRQDL